jgi:hypothetical protein
MKMNANPQLEQSVQEEQFGITVRRGPALTRLIPELNSELQQNLDSSVDGFAG